MSEPLVPKLTPEEDMWEAGQALKVLALGDLRYINRDEWLKAIKYEPIQRKNASNEAVC